MNSHLAFIVVLIFISSIITVYSLSILQKESFVSGDSVTVTCSADAIDWSPFIINGFVNLMLSRKTYLSSQVEILAWIDAKSYLLSFAGHLVNWKKDDPPTGRDDWTITLPSVTAIKLGDFMTNYMNITLTMTTTKCQDSGLYYCKVELDKSGIPIKNTKSQPLNEIIMIPVVNMKVVPENPIYEENEAISITCYANARENFTFSWSRRCPSTNDSVSPRFVTWPVDNHIGLQTKEPLPSANGEANQCGVYTHRQSLIFLMTSELDKCMIKCEIAQNGQDTQSNNFTVVYKAASSASVSTGVIIGVLALVCLVGAVAGFFVAMKRGNTTTGQ